MPQKVMNNYCKVLPAQTLQSVWASDVTAGRTHNVEPLQKHAVSEKNVGLHQVFIVWIDTGADSTVCKRGRGRGSITAVTFLTLCIFAFRLPHPSGPILHCGYWWRFPPSHFPSASAPRGHPEPSSRVPVKTNQNILTLTTFSYNF